MRDPVFSGSHLEMEKSGGSDSDRDPVTGLSAKDRDAIRTSWTIVSKDIQANGTAFMIRSVEPHVNVTGHRVSQVSNCSFGLTASPS